MTSISTGAYARRAFLKTLGAMGIGAIPFLAEAAVESPIELCRILFGFASGSADSYCRLIATHFGGYANSTIVDNRTGAGGQIAAALLTRSPPDGATLLFTPSSILVVYPHTYKKLAYDPFKEIQPVGVGAVMTFAIAVGAAAPPSVRTLADFVAWTKANPQFANYGSPAAGSVPHFVGVLFSQDAKADLRHIPYRGTQPAIVDLMGGQIGAVMGPVGEFLPHLPGGKIRLLATSGAHRSPFTKDVPTFVESGYPNALGQEWLGFFAPAKVPADIIKKANTTLNAALAAPDVVASAAMFGFAIEPSTPEQLAQLMREDFERWGPIVKKSGFTVDS